MEKYVLKLPGVYQSHQPEQKHFLYLRLFNKSTFVLQQLTHLRDNLNIVFDF